MSWWVNSESDLQESSEDLHGAGYAELPDPKMMLERPGGQYVYMHVKDSEGADRFVPVTPERVEGELRWRWIASGHAVTESELKEFVGDE